MGVFVVAWIALEDIWQDLFVSTFDCTYAQNWDCFHREYSYSYILCPDVNRNFDDMVHQPFIQNYAYEYTQFSSDSFNCYLYDISSNTIFGKISSGCICFYSICMRMRSNCMVFSTHLKSNVCIQASYDEKLGYKRSMRIALIIYDLCIQWNYPGAHCECGLIYSVNLILVVYNPKSRTIIVATEYYK